MRRFVVFFLLTVFAVSVFGDDRDRIKEGPVPLNPYEHGVGRLLPDLPVTTLDGTTASLSERAGKRGLAICLFSIGCPLSKKFAPRLERLIETWSDRGVSFLLVDTAPSTTKEEFAAARKKYGFDAPASLDPQNTIKSSLGAQRTTEVFLLDAARTLVYRGAIDDQYGIGYVLPEPTKPYFKQALKALEKGKRPPVAATRAPGCELPNWEKKKKASSDGPVTYHNRISRIVQNRCQVCHRPGESGPFSLLAYDDAVDFKSMIARVVRDRTMPPWFSSGEHSRWRNSMALTEAERADILSWIEKGCPEGDPDDAPLPRAWPKGWRIGTPDVVLKPDRMYDVPAEGVVPYRYTAIRTQFGEDRWVRAMEIRPRVPEVVHHVLVFIRYPKGHPDFKKQPRVRGGLKGFFAGMVPGQGHFVFPKGTAKRLPRGSELVFQIHYTPNGFATKDRPRLALRFADGPPERIARTEAASTTRFIIPPGAPNHPVKATYTFRRSGQLVAFSPHMHVRGKAFRYVLETPDGKRRTLLDIPEYDFNWQLTYELQTPITVRPGTRLHATGWFDNSPDNPANPDPNKAVTFGEQTWDEMMIGYFHWTHPNTKPAGKKPTREKQPKRADF